MGTLGWARSAARNLAHGRLFTHQEGATGLTSSVVKDCRPNMTSDINLLLVHKLQQYQVRVPVDTTFAQLKVTVCSEKVA